MNAASFAKLFDHSIVCPGATSEHVRRFAATALAVLLAGCAGQSVRETWYPVPEHETVREVSPLRGSEAAALPWREQAVILREIVRGFYRPMRGQARWIDPRPLAHRRLASADSSMSPREDWGAAIVEAVGLTRVCLLAERDEACRGRPGGVLRFSVPYALGSDSAVVYARYAPLQPSQDDTRTSGFELEFRLQRSEDGWHTVSRRTVAAPTAP
jgi:hypothetical protein